MRRSLLTWFKLFALVLFVWFGVAAKPAAAPVRWRPLIGEYVLNDQTLIILESDGKLVVLFNRKERAPLDEISKGGFKVFEAEWWHFDFKDWQKYKIGTVAFDQIP